MDEENKPKKKMNKATIKGIAIGVVGTLVITFSFNTVFSYSLPQFEDTDKKLSQIDRLLEKNYVDDITDEQQQEMYNNIYRGYVAGVGDKYTTYMDPDTFSQFLESTNGQYAGIGASVSNDKTDNMVTIVNPFPNSPAEKCGLESGDKIVSVEGTDVFGEDLDTAISLLKGEPGTDVTFDVLKKSTGEIETVTATRAQIDVPTVNYEMLEDNIGYIHINSFDRVTSEQYKTALADLTSQNMEGLVLDLRDNPGGLLDVVCEIADTLVPEGVIVYTEDKAGNKEYMYSEEGQIEVPLVVLINEYSASASEVLTCAIKDYGVGTVVGEQSYGKGVVQSLFPMNDGSALKITISKYYSPDGYSINGVGITPDVEVPFDEMQYGAGYNLPHDEDVQLQKAIEIIESEK